MYNKGLLLSLLLASTTQLACGQSEADRMQISGAVLPLPEDMREGAAVLGFRAAAPDRLVELREGTNDMICLADKPGDENYHVACYHESLEPFMSRGRELRTEGKERDEVARIRREEIENGALVFPDHPAALYSRTGKTYNAETGQIEESRGLHVIYMPYATAEETGLATAPANGAPWLMFSGLPWAHVMISTD
ncbi:MAG: hypothetical protein KJO98_00705 [Rhodothermia bacterium]|nr:hypothetical protein [Rhodothermia bacterium]